MINRRYSDLASLPTFDERYEYLRLEGDVGRSTFGHDRYLNQNFYSSHEWARVRDFVIVRDNGCDLGVFGHEIVSEIYVHHMNPMTPEDIAHKEEWILDPEYLITTSLQTHNAIHFGSNNLIPKVVAERQPNDTKLW